MTDVPRVSDLIARHQLDEIFLTDKGNGMRFRNLYGDVARYVLDRDEWIVWDGTHWEPDPSDDEVINLTNGVIQQIRDEAAAASDEPTEGGGLSARDRLSRWATATESIKAQKRILESATQWPQLRVKEEELDSNPDHLVCTNGTIDLHTGELLPSLSSHMNTRCCVVSYDPEATSPLLDQFFETFMPDPADQDVMFAVLGTCLRGYNYQRIFPFFLGATTSGKTQLMAAVRRLFGSYTCSINSSVFRGNLDDKPRPDLVRAMFTRLACATEASKVWELHADQIKRLTGGMDPISYRQLHSKTVEHVPRFTPLIVTNEMPRIKGADTALKRRMIVIRFDRTISPDQEDATIKDQFVHDECTLQAILARTVTGARSPLIKDGIRWEKIPRHFALATIESFGMLDRIDEFLAWMGENGYLTEAPTEMPTYHMAMTNDLHKWYFDWLRRYGDTTDWNDRLRLTAFNTALRERGWESKPSAGLRWIGKKITTMPFELQ